MNFTIDYLKFNKEIYELLIKVLDSYNNDFDIREFNILSE
jgi:hypothetical protein